MSIAEHSEADLICGMTWGFERFKIQKRSGLRKDVQVIPNFRIRTVPVLGTTPAIFGMAAASWILCRLAGQPYIPEPMFIVKVKILFEFQSS